MVLLVAQAEAARWGLHSVKLLGPSPAMQEMVKRTGTKYRHEDCEKDKVCSLRWYGKSGQDEVEWVGNEKYACC